MLCIRHFPSHRKWPDESDSSFPSVDTDICESHSHPKLRRDVGVALHSFGKQRIIAMQGTALSLSFPAFSPVCHFVKRDAAIVWSLLQLAAKFVKFAFIVVDSFFTVHSIDLLRYQSRG